MKLNCLRTDGNCEHDADYETAVEIRNYTIAKDEALYELPNGARLLFIQSTTTTTGTYLEPDFDHLEATGEAGYVKHDDENFGTKTSTSTYLYGLIPGRHGDECNYGHGNLSDGWEVFCSFDPSKFSTLEDWNAGVVACFPEQSASSLVRAYDQRVSENRQAFLDGLVSKAMDRIDASVARAYDTLLGSQPPVFGMQSQDNADLVSSHYQEREKLMTSNSVPMHDNARAKLLPFLRLAELDDPSALAGTTPRMRVCIEAGELKFSADVFANEAGKVRFSPWNAERLDDELGAESLQLSEKELPDPVQKILLREKTEIENSARHGWIDARLVVIDETKGWSEDIVQQAGKMYCTYLYDAQRVTYCCELSPSYELNRLYENPLNYHEDDAAREQLLDMISDGAAHSDDIVYMHCLAVDRKPDANLESYHCFAIDPDEDYRKQFDSIREDLLGNPRLELPEDAEVRFVSPAAQQDSPSPM